MEWNRKQTSHLYYHYLITSEKSPSSFLRLFPIAHWWEVQGNLLEDLWGVTSILLTSDRDGERCWGRRLPKGVGFFTLTEWISPNQSQGLSKGEEKKITLCPVFGASNPG